ncbi:MAG: serine hydrolase domain-containing protein [Anaerolineae bacterium]
MNVYNEKLNHLTAETFTRLNQVIEAHLPDNAPAVAMAVIHEGRWLLEAGWHNSDTQPDGLTESALFDLASVTKPFTATAFLALVSAGKVALDDPIVTVIPEFGAVNPRGMDGGQDPHTKALLPTPENVYGHTIDPAHVTFRHLLNHTSGLAPWRAVYLAAGAPPTPPDTPDPVSRETRWSNGLGMICESLFVGEPGDTVRYSDLGMMLLGETVARLYGGTLDAAVQALVLDPLKLTSVTYNPVRNGRDRRMIPPTEHDPAWRGRRCWGEVHDENACGVGGVAGHAGLFGTAHDIASFGQAWLSKDARLGIAPELMQAAITHQVGGEDGTFRIGYCWMLKAYEDSSAGVHFSQESFGHTGFTGTSLWVDPEKSLVVACLTNRVYPGREVPGIHALRQAVHSTLAEGIMSK